MNSRFATIIESLEPSLQRLLDISPEKPAHLPTVVPKAGIYLFSERERHLYVGRTNDIRKRLHQHSRPSATDRQAAFAFRLARGANRHMQAPDKEKGPRAVLMADPKFCSAFTAAKARVRQMDVRWVEEADPIRQALLEIYVAFALDARNNDFDNH
ncbi:MAG: GIY-YIG nuclease family protein [Elusimicrobia bacterium]|nr:GIY-YIG nuclease family protein [Elusimicrobiota bacterium]